MPGAFNAGIVYRLPSWTRGLSMFRPPDSAREALPPPRSPEPGRPPRDAATTLVVMNSTLTALSPPH